MAGSRGRPHWLLHLEQTQAQGVPKPTVGLCGLLVQLCTEVMVAYKEINH